MNFRFQNKTNFAFGRRGVAAVEAALMLPLLVVVTFGSIDLAQYINLGQVVCNASREGARIASRNDVTSVNEVETAIIQYMANSIPHLSASELASAVKIRISNSGGEENNDEYEDYSSMGNGEFISYNNDQNSDSDANNGNLGNINSGDPIVIEVNFDFNSIRWLWGLTFTNPTTTTVCRRD